jgi:hypothetical protein
MWGANVALRCSERLEKSKFLTLGAWCVIMNAVFERFPTDKCGLSAVVLFTTYYAYF